VLSLNLALVLHRFTRQLFLAIFRTDDVYMTGNRFPSKTRSDQIQLRRYCGVLLLEYGYVHCAVGIIAKF